MLITATPISQRAICEALNYSKYSIIRVHAHIARKLRQPAMVPISVVSP